MAGQITSPNLFNGSVNLNGVTEARFNMANATKDPHWWVAVGGRFWSAGSMAGPQVLMVRGQSASPPSNR